LQQAVFGLRVSGFFRPSGLRTYAGLGRTPHPSAPCPNKPLAPSQVPCYIAAVNRNLNLLLSSALLLHRAAVGL
jgi:hypothetical protein